MHSIIRLEKFDKKDYHNLIAWIDSEEMLVQIAGRQMQFPVTAAQLDLSQSDSKRFAFSIIYNETNRSIGHCELYLLESSARIDRVIIGDKTMKGKGICGQLMTLLLRYGFNELNLPAIELNVFDWNASAIKCYEKAGLTKNINKTMEMQMNGQTWIAFNMSIDKQSYAEISENNKIPG